MNVHANAAQIVTAVPAVRSTANNITGAQIAGCGNARNCKSPQSVRVLIPHKRVVYRTPDVTRTTLLPPGEREGLQSLKLLLQGHCPERGKPPFRWNHHCNTPGGRERRGRRRGVTSSAPLLDPAEGGLATLTAPMAFRHEKHRSNWHCAQCPEYPSRMGARHKKQRACTGGFDHLYGSLTSCKGCPERHLPRKGCAKDEATSWSGVIKQRGHRSNLQVGQCPTYPSVTLLRQPLHLTPISPSCLM